MTTLYVFFGAIDKLHVLLGASILTYPPAYPCLMTSFFCTILVFMATPADIKAILSSLAGRKVTATDIAEILDISRNSANTRLKNGLVAEDVIATAKGLKINPTEALVELGKLTRDEVFAYIDGGDTLLANASTEQLVYRLAEDTLSNIEKIELGAAARAIVERDDLAKRCHSTPVSPPSVRAISDDDSEGFDDMQYAASRRKRQPSEGDDDYGPGA